MVKKLEGTPSTPVLSSEIEKIIIERTNELYGPLEGMETAAAKIATHLLEIAAKEQEEYEIVIGLYNDGSYFFSVQALRYIAQRPRCRSWDGPGYYLIEVGCLGGGRPFDKHFKHWLLP